MKRTATNILFLLVIAVFLQMVTGCSGCSQSGIQRRAERNAGRSAAVEPTEQEPVQQVYKNSEPSAAPLPLNQLFKKYQSAVFMVFTSDGSKDYQGTGFFISADGIAVSSYHVFEGTTEGSEIIRTAGDRELKVERILAQSSSDDYIIFKVALTGVDDFTPIPIAAGDPEIGEDVFAIGNPYGLEHTLSKGIVSGYRDNRKLIQSSAEITHGSSGGPLLNMRGEVVGITTAGMGEANINFAVNIQVLELDRYR